MTSVNLSPLANHLWQSTFCVGIAWLLTQALRRNRAAVRYWVWLGASVKFLIPFSLLVAIGTGSHWGWRNAPVIGPKRISVAVEKVGQPFVQTIALPRPSSVPRTGRRVPAILFAVWLCGFGMGAFYWLRSWQRVRAIQRAATPLPLGLPIPAMSVPGRWEPGVFGIRRLVLLLPAGIAERLTPDQLDAVIAHELCHVQRRDNLTAAVHVLVETIFWFHPLMSWIRARLVEERERACDEQILDTSNDPQVYAEGILAVCKFYFEAPAFFVSGITGADLKQRIARIVANQIGRSLSLDKKLLLAALALAAFVVPVIAGLQSPGVPEWQVAAGGKAAFDVASVKVDPPDAKFVSPLFPLDDGDTYRPTGGKFKADFPLIVYIQFAYKYRFLPEQTRALMAHLPKWVASDRFPIEAQIEGKKDPSKDQMRLAMQSLLAERFKLAVHFETQEVPVFDLTLIKPGKLGPNLRLHADGPACGAYAPPSGPPVKDGPYPPVCDVYMRNSGPNGYKDGSRNTTVELLARSLSTSAGRPVLDKTGLKERIDFIMDWAPEPTGPPPADGTASTEPQGPTLLQALHDQLGLKLEATKGMVQVLIIDHLERPSAN